MLYYCAEQHSQIHNSTFLFDKGLWPQVLYSKVGGIVPGRLSKIILTSFLFLPNGSFSPKYHLFDSALLSRIVFISTGQDPAINWDFGPRRRPQFKKKKKKFHKIVCLFVALSLRKYKDRVCEIK